MKIKLSMNRILTVLSIILVLALPTLPILSIKPAFAATVTLPFGDGFESGDFSKWSVLAGGSVTSGGAYNGTYKAVFSSGYIQAVFTTDIDDCFMRAYVWLDTAPSVGGSTSIFGLFTSGVYMAEAGVTNVAGILRWTLRYYDDGVHYTVVSGQQKPVLNKWYCVEVEGKSNSATDAESRMYVDGNELTDVTQTGKNNTHLMHAGYLWISSPGSATVWYDDVVIDTAYIPPEEAGQVYTLSVSTVGQGSVNTDRSPPYHYGDVVQFTAVPEPGWGFSSWSGDLSGSTNPATMTFDGNKTVTATFTPNTYTLTVPTVGSGSVTLNNTGPIYNYGDVVQLTAVPATNWNFQGWSGDLSGTANPATILLDANKTVTATFNTTRIFEDGFETADFSKWSPVVGSPSVTSGDARDGTYKAVLSTAGQYAQYRFTSAAVDQCFMRAYVMFKSFPATATESTILGVYKLGGIYMAEARVANVAGTAKWKLRYFDNGVHYSAVSELQEPVLDRWYCVEVEGKSNTATGAESRIYIDGNELTDVSQTGKNNTYLIDTAYIWVNSAVTQWYDSVVVDTAYIGPETYTLSVSKVGQGSVSLNATAPYYYGDVVELTAVPSVAWSFDYWSGDLSGSSNPATLVMTVDLSVTAHFSVIHDVATTDVTSYKTILFQGFTSDFNVTAENHGGSPETFNVTLYANMTATDNTTMIAKTTVSLLNGTSTVLNFTWNTTGFAKGNYTIIAAADVVQGETKIDDNNFTGGWVVVAGVGDLTGGTPNALDFVPDGQVNIVDVAVVAKFFIQKVPPAPANCDVSGPTVGVPDGKIDISDVALVARHFGQIDP